METWKPIAGEEDYEISDHGNVASLRYRNRRGWRHLLSPTPGPKGHLCVVLSNRKQHRVHILVLENFVGPRPPGMLGLHKDGNPAHNHVENLYWGTHSNNGADAVRHGTHSQASKAQCPRGHDYDGVRVWPDGSFRARYCKRCNNDQSKKSKLKGTIPNGTVTK